MDTRATILIVDDEPLLLTAARRVMEQAGYTAISAPDGETALRLAQTHQPDLVLMDVNLPDIDGFEVCRRLKADPLLARMCVLMVSGTHTDADSKAEGLDLGAEDYLVRPYSNRELVARVRALLRIKTAQESLRALSTRQEAILAAVPDILMEVNTNKVYTWANSTGLGFFGEEVLGKEAGFYFEGEQDTYDLVKPLFNGSEDVIYVESWQRRKDGAKRLLAWHCRMLKDSDGNITGALSSAQDITERKQAEGILKESQVRFATIFRSNPAAIAITRIDNGQLVDVNEAWQHVTGFEQSEVVGQTPIGLNLWVNPEQREHLIKMVQEHGQGRGEIKLRRKSGEVRDLLMSAEMIELTGARYLLTMAQDITERKRVEEALRASEANLQALFSATQESILLIEPDGIVLAANPTVTQRLNASTRPLVGNNVFDYLSPEVAQQRRAYANQVCITGQAVKFEDRRGSAYMINSLAPVLDASGQVVRLAIFGFDITEHKRAEEEIRQLNIDLEQRVEARTRELRDAQEQLVRHEKLSVLGQMAGNVGHELRNPLAVIQNAVFYLKLIQPDAADKVRQYHSIIEQETHTAEKIITDLLDFSRITSVDREPSIVAELLQQTLDRNPVPSTVAVTLDLPAGLPPIYADPQHFFQVLGNLVVNAYQAMPAGGQLSISAHQQEQMVAIAVTDTGVGIPPENMKKLFEPLFTTKPRGIGLGLAVSQKLIEANHGRIKVQSKLGQGSTFTVYLPVQAEAIDEKISDF